jgi:hypothetical protein
MLAQNVTRGFHGCSEASTACIAVGRIALLLCKGMYKGHKGQYNVILEAVADYDLWIWYAFFGMAGTHNDINVLDAALSPVFVRLTEGQAPTVYFEDNGHA